MLAKAVASESGAHFINVNMSAITSKWFGEGERLVRCAPHACVYACVGVWVCLLRLTWRWGAGEGEGGAPRQVHSVARVNGRQRVTVGMQVGAGSLEARPSALIASPPTP